MTESALSDEADPLYPPLVGLEAWAAARVDEAAWTTALGRLRAVAEREPNWGDMVAQGSVLAAAHRSCVLDSLCAADDGLTVALLRGTARLDASREPERAHVRANYEAVRLAAGAEEVSEATILRVHEAACRPQLTHRVRVEDRVQDHVLAAGEYKHHPNHVPLPGGGWRASAPVALVRPEMARVVEAVGSHAFADLHPVARAAYVHDAVQHVQPFADGNGRVARALASGCLLRSAGVPFVVLDRVAYEGAGTPADMVDVVLRACVGLVELVESSRPDAGALDQWRQRAAIGGRLRADLVPALERALAGPRDRGWHADLSATEVTTNGTIVVRVPIEGRGTAVDETLTIDAHPVVGGPVTVTAREAQLRLEAGAPVEPWLDRVVSVLALRVAAELEDEEG